MPFYLSNQLGRAVKALSIGFFLLHCQRFESHHWQFFSFFQKLTEKIVIQVRFSTPSAQNPEEKLIIPCPRWPNVPKNTGKPAKYREIVLCSDLCSSNKWKKIPSVAQCATFGPLLYHFYHFWFWTILGPFIYKWPNLFLSYRIGNFCWVGTLPIWHLCWSWIRLGPQIPSLPFQWSFGRANH